MIAIAGISGYTGRRVLPLLDAEKVEAKLLLRPSTAKRAPWKDDPRVVGVDLLDERALEPALRGVDTIVCLVGTTRARFSPAKDGEHAINYENVDIGIPRALANAGKRAGARRFVLLSSYGISAPGAYPAAKRQAEEAVRGSGLDVAILRPSMIVGPGRTRNKATDVFTWLVWPFSRGAASDMHSIDVELLARSIVRLARAETWHQDVFGGRDLRVIGAEATK